MSCVFLSAWFVIKTSFPLWQWWAEQHHRALQIAFGAGIVLCVPGLGSCCLFNAYLRSMRVHYDLPGTEKIQIEVNITYKHIDDKDLLLDVYRPTDASSARPAVLMVHGNGPQFLLDEAKDMGTFSGFGRLIAASSMVAVAFNHRGSLDFSSLAEEQSDVDAAVDYVRTHATEFGIDAERLCLFSFSAGGVYLSKVLRERPSYVRSIVAYYSALDLNEFKELLGDKLSAEQLQKQSPAAQLDTGNTALMPMLIVKAARDREDINRSIGRFVAKAHKHNANIEMLVHPQGQHGFDVLDDDAHTRTIIKRTLEFMQTTLEQ